MRVGTPHLGSALLSGFLCACATPSFPERKDFLRLPGCIHAYFMRIVGLVPMAAAGKLVATASADGQHSADD